MTPEAILSISAAVIALVQLIKWAGMPDAYGHYAVLLLAALGVGLYAYTTNTTGFQQGALFSYFTGWIAVATSSAGVYGFTRAVPAVTAWRKTDANSGPPTVTAIDRAKEEQGKV